MSSCFVSGHLEINIPPCSDDSSQTAYEEVFEYFDPEEWFEFNPNTGLYELDFCGRGLYSDYDGQIERLLKKLCKEFKATVTGHLIEKGEYGNLRVEYAQKTGEMDRESVEWLLEVPLQLNRKFQAEWQKYCEEHPDE